MSPKPSRPQCRSWCCRFSTDQFAGAAAIEQAGIGEALDPNALMPDEIAAAAERLLALDGVVRARLERLGDDLRRTPGAQRARALLTDSSV